ncbi:glycosyltransferase family 4 protein [Glaesserella parasuis]|nr:glycosyltransferase family 4 protein [Glaesserella parasuis]MDD2155484.1 glycosyltransferase family 4 protein [Glaesserella parasuis]MDE3998597.1 glycosyltransferase family 4 protein [Glaesserella parasuis]MDG6296196.1 glycosyltransferase family 4 protein [Glaesserella parasuis]MDP0027681.1 glycosyltransferase family 4 protein [Glaesserella parasuis]MDP0235519.1 glycosyltransferase family 4 protein [Glaesserella parasuis]
MKNSITFIGQVSHQQVPLELDIYVALGRLESFCVAIIEAGAMRLPCIVSNVGGLPEVVRNNETGIIVPRENPKAAAEALEKLVLDVQLQNNMGNAAYDFVRSHFAWDSCVNKMNQIYKQLLGK